MRVALVLALVAGAMIASACSDPGRRGRSDVAVEAGDASLSPSQVAEWAARVPTGRPTSRDVEFVSIAWVDYALLARAAADGLALGDSLTAVAALMPDLTLLRLRKWRDTLIARRPQVPTTAADTLFAEPGFRLFQHILLRVTDHTDLRIVSAVRARADSLTAEMREGVAFATLARQYSEDAATRDQGGYLPPGRRGNLPPEFERRAFGLQVDQFAGVATPAGFHLVRRPPLEEVRDRLHEHAQTVATVRADSVYLDSLTRARRLTVSPQAIALLRGFFADPSTRSDAVLATWDDGALTLDQAALWADLLQPRPYLDLRGASDVALASFIREHAQQRLMASEAERAGVRVTGTEWAALLDGYRRGLRESLGLLGVSEDNGDPIAPGEAPGRAAAVVEGLTQERMTWRPLPSGLGAQLRKRFGYRLHAEGIAAAVAEARRRAR